MRPIPTHQDCIDRLELIFPKEAFDSTLSNPLAGWAVRSMLYCDAVVPATADLQGDESWVRPTTVLWFSDQAAAHADEASRKAWLDAAVGSNAKRSVEGLHAEWGERFVPAYGDNSRETVRDETWPAWEREGAARQRPGVRTTSGAPRWALTDAFADLFAPGLTDQALLDAIEQFRSTHMTPGGKTRARAAQQRSAQQHAVTVTLPSGETRSLEPGEASLILKGVIEEWAPARLHDAVVISISEPGDKTYTDAAMVQSLGLSIDPTTLLPDAIIADIAASSGTTEFWIVEAVATDGEINETRKTKLVEWAARHNIEADACRFLTAFSGRNSSPAKRRLKDLASGTYAWYADEPTRELAWYELPEPDA